jgi:hypothetical protein
MLTKGARREIHRAPANFIPRHRSERTENRAEPPISLVLPFQLGKLIVQWLMGRALTVMVGVHYFRTRKLCTSASADGGCQSEPPVP